MWEHRQLPSVDPLDCTSAVFGTGGQARYQLTQSWLAQVVVYAAYLLGGFAAASVLRAVVLTGLFVALYRLARRTGAGQALSALLVALAFAAVVRELKYIENRPQMWSSLLFVALLLVLENARDGRRWARIALTPLMIVWANLHGGYLIGIAAIATITGAAWLTRHPERRRLLVAGAVAIAATGCSPSGYDVLLYYPRWRLSSSLAIYEDRSLFSYVSVASLPRSRPALAAVFVLPLLTLAPRLMSLRRERPDLLALFALTLGLGIKAQRFLVFLVPMACWVVALNVAAVRDGWLRPRLAALRRGVPAGATTALIAAVALSLTAWYARIATQVSVFGPGANVRSPVEGAADFLAASRLRGNVFNEYSLGGYLAWWLNPDRKSVV
jgi:hypothetical protein